MYVNLYDHLENANSRLNRESHQPYRHLDVLSRVTQPHIMTGRSSTFVSRLVRPPRAPVQTGHCAGHAHERDQGCEFPQLCPSGATVETPWEARLIRHNISSTAGDSVRPSNRTGPLTESRRTRQINLFSTLSDLSRPSSLCPTNSVGLGGKERRTRHIKPQAAP